MDTTNDRAFDDDARARLWESGLYDRVREGNVPSPMSPLTAAGEEEAALLARLIRFASDHAAGLVSEDYLRREALAVLVAIKTNAFGAGVDAGMAIARGE